MAPRLVVAVTDCLSTLGVVLPQLSKTHTTFMILLKKHKIIYKQTVRFRLLIIGMGLTLEMLGDEKS